MKRKVLILFTLLTLLTTGCGASSKEVLAFQNELDVVFSKMENIHNELESLDVSNKDASAQALEALSNLKTAFEELSAIDVKDDEYAFINDLAIEGSQFMDQAYNLFEDAFSGEEYDNETASLAYQYLERASKRVNVIITMLHGEVPDDVIVH